MNKGPIVLEFPVANRIKQLNPWLAHPEKGVKLIRQFLPAEYVQRRIEEIPIRSDRAMLIVGPRQAGKSTMVWHRLKSLAPHILFLNMEDPLLRTGRIHAIDLTDHVHDSYPFVKAIFIDEIQHMEEAGLFVKGLVDTKLHIPLWVTGSASFDLRSKTRESLAGRATRLRLLPFGIQELLAHARPTNPIAASRILEEILSHQLVFGSYPSVYLSRQVDEKIMLLNDLVEAFVLRDASDLFRIKRVDAFRKLLSLLAGQIGSLVNMSELASICQVNVGTINTHIEILEESHIVKRVRPFAEGKRREVTGSVKVFFIDNGIRNHLLNSFSQDMEIRVDRGQLLENWVFAEINKALPLLDAVKFWRTKAGAEVDFIIEHGQKIYPVEVKFASLRQPKVSRSIRSFIEAYEPDKFIIVNMTLEKQIRANHTSVQFITPYTLHEWLSHTIAK